MSNKQIEESAPRAMREIVQKKFLEEVIGSAANWKVLVLDDVATRVISSALSMFDIMERRVTIVENLNINRQPFPQMEVVYFITPTIASVNRVLKDFEDPKKPRYGAVHLVFTDVIPNDAMTAIQSCAPLVSRIKTFKEMNMDFLVTEGSVFQFDMPEALPKLFGSLPDPTCPASIGRKLANLCITLNEHPSIRYQMTSTYAKQIATVVNQTLTSFKKANSTFWCHGDDVHQDRERAQLLILDRSFDPLSPLMHEYTYQAMVNDLLPVVDGVISYKSTTNKGQVLEKQAILNDNDELWLELRHNHIAKVIEVIKERMNDIIQNSGGAALQKNRGGDMNITSMAAAVKELPEYQQTMNKLGQHVAVAQQCMDAFSKLGLFNLSQIEQTLSTGVDEDGKEVKPNKFLQLVLDALTGTVPSGSPPAPTMTSSQKVRLLTIYLLAHRSATSDERRQLIQAADLDGAEQQVLLNFERLASAAASGTTSGPSAADAKKGSMFSFLKSTPAPRLPPTPEGQYANTRHITQFRGAVEQFLQNELPADKFAGVGPASNALKESKSAAKSVRKFGNNARWGNKAGAQFEGGRYIVFIAGGICYSEIRAGYELMEQNKKEVIMGSSSLLNPSKYIELVSNLG